MYINVLIKVKLPIKLLYIIKVADVNIWKHYS